MSPCIHEDMATNNRSNASRKAAIMADEKSNKKLLEITEKFKERGANTPNEAQPSVPVQLPLWKELARAIPNHLARSNLFAPVGRGKRKIHDHAQLASRSDVQIYFSGKQLDEADCDVWMQCLHLARLTPLGAHIVINRAEFLRAIGRNPKSGTSYEWLHESMNRLAFGMLSIKTKRYEIGIQEAKDKTETNPVAIQEPRESKRGKDSVIHLITGFDFDEETAVYILSIDPRVRELFSHREFALLDWEKGMLIKPRADLTKYL